MTYDEFLEILEELQFDLDTASEGLDIDVSKIRYRWIWNGFSSNTNISK